MLRTVTSVILTPSSSDRYQRVQRTFLLPDTITVPPVTTTATVPSRSTWWLPTKKTRTSWCTSGKETLIPWLITLLSERIKYSPRMPIIIQGENNGWIDFSGSFIRADKPVAVYSGHGSSRIPVEVVGNFLALTPPIMVIVSYRSMMSQGSVPPMAAYSKADRSGYLGTVLNCGCLIVPG